MKPEPEDLPEIDEKRIMQTVRTQRKMGRILMGMALALGVASLVASVVIVWNIMRVMPMERLLLEDYPRQVQESGKNAEGRAPLTREELDWRLLQVTASHGKTMFLTSLSIALEAAGTLVICGLVMFNRRATLQQITASLAQISNQIKELQEGQSPDPKP